MRGLGPDGNGRLASGGLTGDGLRRGGLRGYIFTGQVGFGDAFAEVVFAADLAGDGRQAVAVGGVDEVCCCEAAVVVVDEVGKVFADEG